MSLSNYYQESVVRRRKEDGNILLQYANKNRKTGLFNDVTITVDEVSFPANRLVLSCYSKFFENMFTAGYSKEKNENTIKLKDFDANSIKMLVDYMYSGVITINGENAVNLLAAANCLQLDEIKEFCFEFLGGGITSNNCLAIITAASLCKNHIPLNGAYQYLSENLIEIAQKDNFKDLSKSALIKLIGKLNRNAVRDLTLYHAIKSWVKFKEESRAHDFPALFQTLDLTKLPCEFLMDNVVSEPLVRISNDCLNLVLDCISRKFKEIQLNEDGSKIICVGGNESKMVVEIFNLCGKSKTIYPPLPYKLSFQCALKHKDFVYCIGGAVNGVFAETTDRVYRMNLKDLKVNWEEIAPMGVKCSDFGATVLGDNLVIAGGYNKGRLRKVEIYKEKKNQWKTIASMKDRRSGNALVTCADRIYAVGGWDSKHLSSVECLSELDEHWEVVDSLQTARRSLVAVSCGGFIYAIGGESPKTEKSVEKYDPVKNKWRYAGELNVERERHSACVLQGKIYVAGGVNAAGTIVKEIECYDPGTDKWTIVGKSEYDFQDHSLVVI